MKFFENLCCLKSFLLLGPRWEIQDTFSFYNLNYVLTETNSYEILRLLLVHMLAAPKKPGQVDL